MAAVLSYLINVKILDPVGTAQDKAVIPGKSVIAFGGVLDPKVFIDHVGIQQGSRKRRCILGVFTLRPYHGVTELVVTDHRNDGCNDAEDQSDGQDYLTAQREAPPGQGRQIDLVS